MQIHGAGILITGRPGIGKGELALELLNRGHRLIADDTPDFQLEGERIIGRCPAPIRDLLEARGLGVLNIRELFGSETMGTQQQLDLLIELRPADEQPDEQSETRICGNRTTTRILGQQLPLDVLYVAPGRHLAGRVETMARRIQREMAGYDLAVDLESRLGRA